MRTIQTMGRVVVLAGVAACGGGATPEVPVLERDFGQRVLPALDTECEGVAGLTGQSILAARSEHGEAQLSYVTAAGGFVDPTGLTLELTWPAEPVATCYPPYAVNGNVIAPARVAIQGLTLRLHTADGRFDETLPARAWRINSPSSQAPLLLAVTTRNNLHGTWRPFPEYEGVGSTVSFSTPIQGTNLGKPEGSVGLGGQDPAELNAAVLRGSYAVGIWR
jgi:hypothetical protein